MDRFSQIPWFRNDAFEPHIFDEYIGDTADYEDLMDDDDFDPGVNPYLDIIF